MSEKREKFVEIAQKRVNKVLNDLRLIGNLSNKNNYAYEEKDVQKIFSAIESEVKMAKAKFSNDRDRDSGEFKL